MIDHNIQMTAEELEEENSDIYSNDDAQYVTKSENNFRIINTNACSLCPKINSLVDCFEETTATIGIITETWLLDGEALDEDLQDLLHGTGLGMVCRNRVRNDRGFSHGGMALVFDSTVCNFKPLEYPNPEEFEVLPAWVPCRAIVGRW